MSDQVIPYPKPGKKRKKKRGVSPEKLKQVYAEVLERDNYTCQNPYCRDGWPLSPPHHVVKKSQYGSDSCENLVVLCLHCHDLIHARGKLKITGIYPSWTFTQL